MGNRQAKGQIPDREDCGRRGLLKGEGGLEPLAGVVDFEGGHPFDPLVAASSGGHQPEGEAVSMGQCFVADGGGEKTARRSRRLRIVGCSR